MLKPSACNVTQLRNVTQLCNVTQPSKKRGCIYTNDPERTVKPSEQKMVELDDFHAYAQIKAFDVISAGHFKRHLSVSRDNGDKWAMQMYNRHNLVQSKVKEIFTLVGQLTTPNSQLIQRVCRDVMSCAQPPIKVLTGQNTCCLTQLNTEHCIDLTRAGKNSKEVFVHTRFWHFFVLLWFCAKLEYVIRACTKQWLETQPVKVSPSNYTRLCEEYTMQNTDLNEQLYRLFMKGAEYITLSLTTFRDKYALLPMLTPPDEFIDDPED